MGLRTLAAHHGEHVPASREGVCTFTGHDIADVRVRECHDRFS